LKQVYNNHYCGLALEFHIEETCVLSNIRESQGIYTIMLQVLALITFPSAVHCIQGSAILLATGISIGLNSSSFNKIPYFIVQAMRLEHDEAPFFSTCTSTCSPFTLIVYPSFLIKGILPGACGIKGNEI
jgi:hypothetical protein